METLSTVSARFEELRISSQEHLVSFIETELQLGFTFLSLAVTSRERGNREHFNQAKKDAGTAAGTARRFLPRISDEEARSAVGRRCLELDSAMAALEQEPNRSA